MKAVLSLNSKTDRFLYLDIRDTHLRLNLQLFTGMFIDNFKRKKAEHIAKLEDDCDEEVEAYLTYVNNLLHFFVQL